MSDLSRRKWMSAGVGTVVAGATGVALADRNGLVPPDCGGVYGPGETLTYAAQRLLTRNTLAREFPRSAISEKPFVNGPSPKDEAFKKLEAGGFADWRLQVDGLVERPMQFSVADLKAFAPSSQITLLACEEGWSYIAEWTGVRLSEVLSKAGMRPEAKFVVYVSMEKPWWDSIDLEDALHPQTLVAYGLNGGALPVGNGGPMRVRVPRQLGYKSVKYVNRITVTDSLKGFGKGLGSLGPEFGYSWYAGI